MTSVVVEVGPATVRGPNLVDPQWVSAGIDAIDDELTLIDDRAVAVDDVWRRVMHDVVGGDTDTIVVVCPTWWPSSRVERVCDAVSAVANDVEVLRRAQVLSDGLSTLVEITPEFVVVSSPGGDVQVVVRGDMEAVLATIPTSTEVLLDGPEGVEGVRPLADRLRANSVAVTIADRDRVRRSLAARRSQDEDPKSPPTQNRGRRATAVMAGTVLSVAVLCGGFAARQDVRPVPASMPMTLLVEGRVGVMVPAQWTVQRVTSGPGTARVQVVSPDDADIAVHVTQSSLPPQQSHEEVAQSLRAALNEEPDGVFVEFNPSERRSDQPMVTYREIRPDHHIAWFVLIDKSLRIAIGCQSAPGHDEAVREACDRAIRSAHAVF
jgi:type VII secretion-associated protein (TIGR03931 family)